MSPEKKSKKDHKKKKSPEQKNIQPEIKESMMEDEKSIEEQKSLLGRDDETEKVGKKEKSKEKSKEKAEEKKEGLPKRILLKALKIILLWLPVIVISLIAIVLIVLKLYLSPERVQDLIITNFNKMSNGKISLKVKDFSPYGGFQIDNIEIRNGKEFNETKLLEMERLVIRYGLFQMLIGNVRIPEIGIYKPRIYLEQKNGVWSAAKLMKPGEKKPEEKKEPEEETGPPSKEISLPISAEFLFKFILDDLRLYVKGESFSSAVEGLTFNIDINIPPFKKIPLSPEAVSILKTMKIELNPREEMNVSFYSKDAQISPPLILTWKLVFSKGEKEKPQFASIFKFGTHKTPVRFKSSHLAPLNFMVSYDIFYDPIKDFLKLNHLGISFGNKKWLNLAGNVDNVTKKQQFYLKMTESNIDLDDLYPYFRSVTGDRKTRFNGSISLFPLSIQGNPKDIDIDGAINLKSVYFKNPGTEATIPSLTLSYSVLKRDENMKIRSNIDLPHLFYALGKNKSGDTGFALGLDVSAYKNFETVELHDINLKLYNPSLKKNRDALLLAILGKVNLKPALSGNIKISRFQFLKSPLIGMLPKNFEKLVEGIPLNKPLNMDLGLNFSLGKEIIAAALGMGLKVPDYNVNDLKLGLNVRLNNKTQWLTLNSFSLGSKEKTLSINASGEMGLKPPLDKSDLKLRIKLNPKKMKEIHPPWLLKGLLQIDAFVKGDLKTGKAYGSIKIDDFYVSDGKYTSIEKLNMAFPFEYYFTPRYKGESRIAVDKSDLIENENFREKENFTIKSIKSKHPERDLQFEYIKDFAATMFFRDNTFELAKLKAYVLDGSLYGRDMLFNLADMKSKNWEYRLILDVTNVDIGKLDEPDPAKKKRDAELSLNANFTGKDLSMFVEKGEKRSKELSVKGYINLYKVGDEFANELMKGLSKEKGESKLGIAQPFVDNSMIPKGFNFNLDKGLVYTTVLMQKKVIGIAIGVTEKLKFERMPIQVYLNNIFGGEKTDEKE